jgi:hypothetical protein
MYGIKSRTETDGLGGVHINVTGELERSYSQAPSGPRHVGSSTLKVPLNFQAVGNVQQMFITLLPLLVSCHPSEELFVSFTSRGD